MRNIKEGDETTLFILLHMPHEGPRDSRGHLLCLLICEHKGLRWPGAKVILRESPVLVFHSQNKSYKIKAKGKKKGHLKLF